MVRGGWQATGPGRAAERRLVRGLKTHAFEGCAGVSRMAWLPCARRGADPLPLPVHPSAAITHPHGNTTQAPSPLPPPPPTHPLLVVLFPLPPPPAPPGCSPLRCRRPPAPAASAAPWPPQWTHPRPALPAAPCGWPPPQPGGREPQHPHVNREHVADSGAPGATKVLHPGLQLHPAGSWPRPASGGRHRKACLRSAQRTCRAAGLVVTPCAPS